MTTMTTTTLYAAVAQDHGQDAGVICYAFSAAEAATIAAIHSTAPIHVVPEIAVPMDWALVLTATVPPPWVL